MKENLKADLYVFDIHYHAEPVEHFQNVSNYMFREVIYNKDYSGNSIEILDTKEQVRERVLTYLSYCVEFTSDEEQANFGTRSAWNADQEKFVDFLNNCVSETGKFVFFTLEGTDISILFVHDYENVKKRLKR